MFCKHLLQFSALYYIMLHSIFSCELKFSKDVSYLIINFCPEINFLGQSCIICSHVKCYDFYWNQICYDFQRKHFKIFLKFWIIYNVNLIKKMSTTTKDNLSQKRLFKIFLKFWSGFYKILNKYGKNNFPITIFSPACLLLLEILLFV